MNNPSSDVLIPAVEHIAGRATGTTAGDGENNAATERGLPAGASDEVIRITIPVPRLNIPAEIKLSELSREVAPRVRAFVRDVRKYFDFVRGGNHDSIRCLFLANALEGAAKTWHDDWTNARLQYTSEQLLDALLIRFAPQIQTRELEALEKLAAGQHQMRANETVAAYHSRFEALIAPIPDLREVDRIFWFIRGLSSEFSGECATDHDGKPFQEYAKLVQHTLGVEARQLAKLRSQAQTRVLLRASTAVQDPAPIITDDGDLPAPEVRPRAATVAAGRNTARQASGAGESNRGRRGRGGKHRDKGRPRAAAAGTGATVLGKRGRDSNPAEWMNKFYCTRAEYEYRRKNSRCLRCGEDKHLVAECPLLSEKRARNGEK
ncbi:hypothetical protein VOLCADRAFT_99601 [Volvox carteri f. nagariensis]|uniref:CCHC-type domain-containing protein n=1 Tax=Volvox carteri f. nagariensis TaxID=3068 RepID=D8UI73_VOLCA|nr:uncharacterized protein VOLCADRAFT_99601 [Volvox carteri f. nagariensis]EFJ40577.1 hypothetical protein VOLCADRAFT_99601 [Volvox carteri f. nagariensis]|eukprot:XP_002958355.1 hypothetical protein VOLCADRAFT_99601 [Volvox carteri f. nagariensis]